MSRSEVDLAESAWNDNHLLQLLQIELQSPKELTKDLALEKSAIHARIQRLEREGVIRRYVAVLDPEKVGITHHDVLLLKLALPKDVSEVALAKMINIMEGVYRAQVIEHSDFDVMLTLAHESEGSREESFRRLLEADFVTGHLVLPLPGRVLKKDIGPPVYLYLK